LVVSGTGFRTFHARGFIQTIRMRYRVLIPQPLRKQQAQHQNHAYKRG
jgi:hypothetical protein